MSKRGKDVAGAGAGGGPEPSDRRPSERPLLRKSSSTGLLDTEQTAADGSVPPKLRRKSSSLRDLTPEESAALQAQEKDKARKKSRRSARNSILRTGTDVDASALPPVTPKTGRVDSQQQLQQHRESKATLPTQETFKRPKRRRRAGDIELHRQATVDIVVKYESTSVSDGVI
ncbi:hypothetical protein PINS_up008873 [Pythium insidiosum]|nr:hypothetical protein PINS_up008873 [Pythium insidiosum]